MFLDPLYHAVLVLTRINKQIFTDSKILPRRDLENNDKLNKKRKIIPLYHAVQVLTKENKTVFYLK